MFAAPSGDKTPPQRNKTGAGGEDVSFEASNNQQGHACGRPLRFEVVDPPGKTRRHRRGSGI
jgi:hypothetical protein